MPDAPGRLMLRARAKINLALAVGPPEPPKGYHPIASWFAAIDLADDLELVVLPAGEASRFTVEWAADAPKASPIDWPIEKDLIYRVHGLLQERAGRVLPVGATLRKRVPVGGGLGGGSGDAAAMLRGLNQLFGLGLGRDELAAIGARLGSDIAFFLDEDREAPRPALVGGFGERLERVAALGTDVLLIVPPFSCPTGPVYQAYDRSPRALDAARVRSLAEGAARTGRVESSELFNDLAEPACVVEPRLRATLERLRSALSVPVHVTGSGSTMFVLDPGAGLEARVALAAAELVMVRTRIVS